MWLQQPPPIVVDVMRQPEATRDISIDTVITIFASAGVILLIAAVGGLVAGAIFIGIRRLRDASAPPSADTEHLRLRI